MQLENTALDLEIEKLSLCLETKIPNFETSLFEHYPKFIHEDYKRKQIVLINGINYKTLTNTEIAYFLSKDPLLALNSKKRQKFEENERPKFPAKKNKAFIEEEIVSKKNIESKNDDGKKTFCVCEQIAGEHEGQMVFCDNCKEWFHPLCVMISKIEIGIINSCQRNKWYCKICLGGE